VLEELGVVANLNSYPTRLITPESPSEAFATYELILRQTKILLLPLYVNTRTIALPVWYCTLTYQYTTVLQGLAVAVLYFGEANCGLCF